MYASLSSNSYYAFSVSQSFVDQELRPKCPDRSNKVYRRLLHEMIPDQQIRELVPKILHTLKEKQRTGELLKQEPLECLEKYALTIQSKQRNVLLVGDDKYFPAPNNFTLFTVTFVDRSSDPEAVNAITWTGLHVFSTSRFSAKDIFGPENAASAYAWMCGTGTNCLMEVQSNKHSPDEWKTGSQCDIRQVHDLQGDGLRISGHVLDNHTIISCRPQAWPMQYCLSEDGEPHSKL